MFVVPKKGGDWRLIINLKVLNRYSKAAFQNRRHSDPKGHYSSQRLHGQTGLKGCLLFRASSRRKEVSQVRVGQQSVRVHMPSFGLTSAPWIFTKLFRPVLAYLRQQGVRCLMYLDDKLLLGNSPEEVKEHFNLCQKLITSLRFTINWKKTVQEPTQTIEFLGFIINSIKMTLSVSLEKLNNLITECKRLLSNPLTTLRNLSHVIGLTMSVTLAVLLAPLHYRKLQFQKNEALAHHHS